RMGRRHRRELFFELEPDRHRINADVLAGEAGQEDLTAVLLFDKTAKGVRNLEPPLVINAGGGTTPEHETLLHSDPQKSTTIVGLCLCEVNRKILCGQQVTPNLRLLIAPAVVRPTLHQGTPRNRVLRCRVQPMLRAALIGFGQTGKTTLFQLMTSAREPSRASHGKAEATIGISKVPDDRLDRLTAMYNPKKRVPATIEFADLAMSVQAGAAQALVDVAAYKNADALVHVVRGFNDPTVPHPSGSVNPSRDAQAMEDELILADLGLTERRLERVDKDLKKGKSPEL